MAGAFNGASFSPWIGIINGADGDGMWFLTYALERVKAGGGIVCTLFRNYRVVTYEIFRILIIEGCTTILVALI